MASIDSLKASDGTGNASAATVQALRSPGATTIQVDTVQGINDNFFATMGTPHTFTDPITGETITVISEATAVDFKGHIDGSDIEIDTIAPGQTDLGSAVGDIIVIRPTTQWGDEVAEVLEVAHEDDGSPKPVALNPPGMVVPFAGSTAPDDWLMCNGSAVSRTTYADLFAAIGTNWGTGDGSTTFNLPDLRDRFVIGAGTASTVVGTVASRSGNVLTLTGLDNTADNEFQTGQAVVFTSSGTTIGGLTSGNTYYLIRTGNLTFSLATTRGNALLGTAITLSSDGTGTRTLTLTLSARTLGESGGEEDHALTEAELAAHRHVENSQNLTYVGSGGQFNPPGGGIVNTGSYNTNYAGGDTPHNNLPPFAALNYIIKT